MVILKCRMCGGDLEYMPGTTVTRCPYCGTVQTLPGLGDERRANLFARADELLRGCEFERAAAAYEKILEADNTDAEAHWRLALARYGIQYVVDPRTGRRVPTCHRMQPDSILRDVDCRAAIGNAPDGEAKALYEQEARRIDGIQREYLSVSGGEAPWDVFICYKDADDLGSRTPDSVEAQRLYNVLIREGYRVFFARVTLENKLGRQYEPYIYSALSTARVMLVVAASGENADAVWVRNEWGRYLARMKRDASLLLVPCCKGMRPKDLPPALARLQCLDMDAPGADLDILHLVRKAVGSAGSGERPDSGVEPLLERAFLLLEDGEFDHADECCEQVLNRDPKNARAYLVKLMIALRVKKPRDLKRQKRPFDGEKDYEKVMRFGDEALKAQLRQANEAIIARNERLRKQRLFEAGKQRFESAATSRDMAEAAELLSQAGDYPGAAALLAECERLGEALKEAEKPSPGEKLLAWLALVLAVALLALGAVLAYRYLIKPASDQRAAQSALEQGRFDEAEQRFAALGDEDRVMKTRHARAQAMLDAGEYDAAKAAFEALNGYGDSARMAKECVYQKAEAFRAQGRYTEAFLNYTQISKYMDVPAILTGDADIIAAADRAHLLGSLVSLSAFQDGVAVFRAEGGTTGLITDDWQIKPVALAGKAPAPAGGRFATRDSYGKYGLVDLDGNVVCAPQWDDIAMDDHGTLLVCEGLIAVKRDDKWGLLNLLGNLVSDLQWDDIAADHKALLIGEGLIPVKQGGKWGFLNLQGDLVCVPRFSDYAKDDDGRLCFDDGAALVVEDRKYGFIDTQGRVIVEPVWDSIWHDDNGRLRSWEGSAWMGKDKQYGRIDTRGNVIVQSEWDNISGFNDGLAWVKKDGKCGFVDEAGRVVIDLQWDEVNGFFEGLARVKQGDRWGFIDKKGNVVIDLKWEYAGDFQEGLAAVKQDGKWGYLDRSGNIAIESQWEACSFFSDGLAMVEKDGKWGLIGPEGQQIADTQWDWIDRDDIEPGRIAFKGGLAKIEAGGKYGLIDTRGQVVAEPEYERLEEFEGALAQAIKGDQVGFLNRRGEFIVGYWLGTFSEGLAAFAWSGLWGYLSDAGDVAIEPRFTEAAAFSEGLAAVKEYGKWGYVDANGEWVIEPQFSEAAAFSEGLAAAKQGGKWGYIDAKGAWAIAPQWDGAFAFHNDRALVTDDSGDKPLGLLIDAKGQLLP